MPHVLGTTIVVCLVIIVRVVTSLVTLALPPRDIIRHVMLTLVGLVLLLLIFTATCLELLVMSATLNLVLFDLALMATCLVRLITAKNTSSLVMVMSTITYSSSEII